MHMHCQHRAKWRLVVDAVITELNEEAEEMGKMEKIRGRKEMGEASIRSDRPIVYTQPGCTFTEQTRHVLSITNNRI